MHLSLRSLHRWRLALSGVTSRRSSVLWTVRLQVYRTMHTCDEYIDENHQYIDTQNGSSTAQIRNSVVSVARFKRFWHLFFSFSFRCRRLPENDFLPHWCSSLFTTLDDYMQFDYWRHCILFASRFLRAISHWFHFRTTKTESFASHPNCSLPVKGNNCNMPFRLSKKLRLLLSTCNIRFWCHSQK